MRIYTGSYLNFDMQFFIPSHKNLILWNETKETNVHHHVKMISVTRTRDDGAGKMTGTRIAKTRETIMKAILTAQTRAVQTADIMKGRTVEMTGAVRVTSITRTRDLADGRKIMAEAISTKVITGKMKTGDITREAPGKMIMEDRVRASVPDILTGAEAKAGQVTRILASNVLDPLPTGAAARAGSATRIVTGQKETLTQVMVH
jgi:hypothetical protein